MFTSQISLLQSIVPISRVNCAGLMGQAQSIAVASGMSTTGKASVLDAVLLHGGVFSSFAPL